MAKATLIRPLLILGSLVLSGCGTHVPDIQENPFASEQERSDFIQAVDRNIKCEVQDAIVRLYAKNQPIDPQNRNLGWFDKWAVQTSLILTTDEKTSLNPTLNLLPPGPASHVVNINLGATVSADAQRVDKIGAFFLVADLKGRQPCDPKMRNRGPFILESDLKLYDWLVATMISIDNGDTPAPADQNGPFKSNVLSHEVKFDIVSTGTVNPGWKLVEKTIDQSGTLFTTTRDRTQDLTITLGPPDSSWKEFVIDPVTNKPKIDPATNQPMTRSIALAPAAANAALASEIGAAIATAVRNGLLPQ